MHEQIALHLSKIAQQFVELTSYLVENATALFQPEAAKPVEPEPAPPKPKKEKGPVSPKRQLQGKYMFLIRTLPPEKKALVKAHCEAHGVESAVLYAQGLQAH